MDFEELLNGPENDSVPGWLVNDVTRYKRRRIWNRTGRAVFRGEVLVVHGNDFAGNLVGEALNAIALEAAECDAPFTALVEKKL